LGLVLAYTGRPAEATALLREHAGAGAPLELAAS
jgi:hypothetical protein